MNRFTTLIFAGFLAAICSGCAATATFIAVESLCLKTLSKCDASDSPVAVPSDVAIEAAALAFELDKAAYEAAKELVLPPPTPPNMASATELCAEGTTKVCSAVTGCHCDLPQ